MRFGFLILLISLSGWATTFAPQTVDQQIKEADGVVIGHYLRSRSVVLESGRVATQMIFKVQREWGLQSDLFGLDEVIVHYPGGKKGNLHVQVQGVPSFVMGERIALFTKSVENRYWGLNLGFGTFKIINYGKETMLVNTLFPHDGRIGQVRLEAFEAKVKAIKGSGLKVVKQDLPADPRGIRSPASLVDDRKKRAIASAADRNDNREDQSGLGIYWLIALLAFAGGVTRFIKGRVA